MMKKLLLVGMLGMAVLLAGCSAKKEAGSNTKEAGGAKALIGTWEYDVMGMGVSIIRWTFTKDKFTQESMGVKTTVPYKVKDNVIFTEYEGAEVEMEFEIDEDTLTIDMGIEMEFERVVE